MKSVGKKLGFDVERIVVVKIANYFTGSIWANINTYVRHSVWAGTISLIREVNEGSRNK